MRVRAATAGTLVDLVPVDRVRVRAATAGTLVDLVLVDRTLVDLVLVAGGRTVRPQVVRDRLPAGPLVVASR